MAEQCSHPGEPGRGKPRRLRYDSELEALAFQRLAEGDPAGCRDLLAQFASRLEADDDAAATRLAPLLLDILQTVNRRLHRRDDATYQRNRLRLIDSLGGKAPHHARRRFLPELDRLLGPSLARGATRHPLVRRARRFIDDHYARRISLSTVAEELAISPNYLSRLFRRETGTTLTRYIQRVRLDHARRMLGEGQASISEIAYRVGYQNYRDFHRNFVKYEHASPRQIRRRLNGELPAEG